MREKNYTKCQSTKVSIRRRLDLPYASHNKQKQFDLKLEFSLYNQEKELIKKNREEAELYNKRPVSCRILNSHHVKRLRV